MNLFAQPGFLDKDFTPVFFPEISVNINAVTVQSDGKILIAGPFSRSGQGLPYKIVRLNEDVTWTLRLT